MAPESADAPAQGFSPTQFRDWARKQTALAKQVYSCYEAGPFGYSLHRKLAGFGITNYVVRPRDWDEYGMNVKTDKRDAKALVLGLDRYVAGNRDAFCAVRVPTEAQEQARSRSRQSGRACRRRSSAWRPRGAATPFIMAPTKSLGSSLEGSAER